MWIQKRITHKKSGTIEDSTVIDTEKVKNKTNKIITNKKNECQENEEFLEEDNVFATERLEITTNNTMDNKITENQIKSEKQVG